MAVATVVIWTPLIALDHRGLALNMRQLIEGPPLDDLASELADRKAWELAERLAVAISRERIAVRRGAVTADDYFKRQSDLAGRFRSLQQRNGAVGVDELAELVTEYERAR